MKSKFFIIALFSTLFTIVAQAQNHIDALRYSENIYGGTAKSLAMGNSLSAVGADMSCLTTNPAGIAVFKKSSMTFSPTLIVNNTESTMLGNTRKEDRFGMIIDNWGIAGVFPSSGVWKQFSFGFTYNRTNNYTQEFAVDGTNTSGSILDFFVHNANEPYRGASGDIDRWSSFREELAYQTFLINEDTDLGEYYSHVTDAGLYGEMQRKIVTRKGGAGEYDFTFGANLGNMLYFGGTLGITSVRFIQTSLYKESGFEPIDIAGIAVEPDYFEFTEDLTTKGTGVNFKYGMLFSPVPFIRLGGAIHSSTFYGMHDTYETSMESAFFSPDDNGDYDYFWNTDPNDFDWRLRTPFRANAGLAIVLDSYEIGSFYTLPMTFSVGYEYVDYARARLDADPEDYDFVNENAQIESQFQAVQNFHAGAEIRIKFFSLRAGYQMYGSPIKGDELWENVNTGYSAGFGFGGEHVFLDFSYTLMQYKQNYNLYEAAYYYPNDPMGAYAPEPVAQISNNKFFANLTFGVRF